MVSTLLLQSEFCCELLGEAGRETVSSGSKEKGESPSFSDKRAVSHSYTQKGCLACTLQGHRIGGGALSLPKTVSWF